MWILQIDVAVIYFSVYFLEIKYLNLNGNVSTFKLFEAENIYVNLKLLTRAFLGDVP